jgi:hypothetical protein
MTSYPSYPLYSSIPSLFLASFCIWLPYFFLPTPQLSSWVLAPRYPFHLDPPVLSLPVFSHLPTTSTPLTSYPPSSARLHLPNPRRRPPVKPSSLVVYAAVKGRHVVARDRREKEQKEGDRTSVNDQSQSTAILALYSCPPPLRLPRNLDDAEAHTGYLRLRFLIPFTPSRTRFGMSKLPLFPIAKLLLPYLILRIPTHLWLKTVPCLCLHTKHLFLPKTPSLSCRWLSRTSLLSRSLADITRSSRRLILYASLLAPTPPAPLR